MPGLSLLPGLSLQERHRATRCMNSFRSLLELDDIWTDHLASVSSMPADDVRVLELLNREMTDLLGFIGQEAEFIKRFLAENSLMMEMTFAHALAEMGAEVKIHVFNSLKIRRGFSQIARQSFEQFVAGIPAEQEALNGKMTTIASGKFVTGDLSGRCAAMAALAGIAGGLGHIPAMLTILGASVAMGCWG